jgi:hypothetical protein
MAALMATARRTASSASTSILPVLVSLLVKIGEG